MMRKPCEQLSDALAVAERQLRRAEAAMLLDPSEANARLVREEQQVFNTILDVVANVESRAEAA
jgi:hypothetical protein